MKQLFAVVGLFLSACIYHPEPCTEARCDTDGRTLILCPSTFEVRVDCGGCNEKNIEANSCDVCGDGTTDAVAGEKCDDGNNLAGDGCSADCSKKEECGDGVKDPQEDCDGTPGCDALCHFPCVDDTDCTQAPICKINGACDQSQHICKFEDLNVDDSNACTADSCDQATGLPKHDPIGPQDVPDDCHVDGCNPITGPTSTNLPAGVSCNADNNTQTIEICRDGGFCLSSFCGDAFIDPQRGEQCEPPNGGACDGLCHFVCDSNADCSDNDPCTTNERCDLTTHTCELSSSLKGTPCDIDSNQQTVDFCNGASLCLPSRCGDGVIDPSAQEACDDGNLVSNDGCRSDCKGNEQCHDGFLDPITEQCDDKNLFDNDSCVANCKIAVCGDGFVQSGVETCDKPASLGGDPGCNDSCQFVCSQNSDCADTDLCTQNERCLPTHLCAVDPVNINDNNACTDDFCSSQTGVGHVAINFIDNNPCTIDACNQTTGVSHDIAQDGALCDSDGNISTNEICSSGVCIPSECGDGILDPINEECDDGNLISNDGCSSLCQVDCGDGIRVVGELCYLVQPLLSTGQTPVAMAFADLDNNLRVDLVVANSSSDNLSIFLNNGAGFTTSTLPTGSDEPEGVVIGFLDNNVTLDIAVANFSGGLGGIVTVVFGDGSGSFGAPQALLSQGSDAPALRLAHLNNDSFIDLITTSSINDNVGVWRNNLTVNNQFTLQSVLTAGDNDRALAVGDLDGLGVDIVTANFGSDNVSVFLRQGDFQFGTATTFPVGDGPRSVELGDLNSDGNLDLVTVNQLSNNLTILFGDGSGSFSSGQPILVGGAPVGLALADFDGDAVLDIAVARQSNNDIAILRGGELLAPPLLLQAGSGPHAVIAADLNNDGVPDLAVANELSNNLSLFLSNP